MVMPTASFNQMQSDDQVKYRRTQNPTLPLPQPERDILTVQLKVRLVRLSTLRLQFRVAGVGSAVPVSIAGGPHRENESRYCLLQARLLSLRYREGEAGCLAALPTRPPDTQFAARCL